MSLKDSQALQSVDPWLKVRLEWIKEVYSIVGGEATIISGRRSLANQLNLYNSISSRPVAFPGCSQHNYGFAADISFGIIILKNSRGFIPKIPSSVRILSEKESVAFGSSLARHVGLTLVAGDDGHVQMYHGSTFRTWAVDRGLCPSNPPPSARQLLLEREAAQDARDDSRLFFRPVATFGTNFFRRGTF